MTDTKIIDPKKAIDDWAKGGNPVAEFPVKRLSLRDKSAAGIVLSSGDDDSVSIKSSERLTDQGDANRLIARHGSKILVVNGKWLAWNGRCWDVNLEHVPGNLAVETAQITSAAGEREKAELAERLTKLDERLAAMTAEELDAIGGRELQTIRKRMAVKHDSLCTPAWYKWFTEAENQARVARTVARAAADSRIIREKDEMDTAKMHFAAANGYIDLTTGELGDYEPMHYGTMCSAVSYDPEAKAPQFESFLEQIQPKPEIRAFLQRWFGYSMSGAMKEHKAVYLLGEGRNGKGTLIHVLRQILGQYTAAAQASTFATPVHKQDGSANTPDLAVMVGVRMVTVSEIAEDDILNEARLKEITGEDPLTAMAKFEKPFTFQPQCKLTFLTNNKPRIKGADFGIWSRLILVPFDVRYGTEPGDKAPDMELKDKLATELPGILNWLVQGFIEWKRVGLKPPAECLAAADDWKTEAAQEVHDFFDECVEIVPDAKHIKVKFSDLYAEYRRWQGRRRNEPVTSKNSFARKVASIKGLGKERGTDSGKTTWITGARLPNKPGDDAQSELPDWSVS